MICPNCNTNNMSDSSFCINCGAPLNNNQNIKEQQPSQKNNKKIIKIIIAIILLVSVAIAVYFIFSSKTSTLKLDSYYDPKKPIRIKKDNLYGYIDTNGKTLIKPQYSIIAKEFNGSYTVVPGKGKNDQTVYNVIDTNGKIKYTSENLSDLEFIIEENVWLLDSTLYDVNLKKLSKDKIKVEYIKDGYFKWNDSDSKEAGIMNNKGEILYTYKFSGKEKYFGFNVSSDYITNKSYCAIVVDNEKYGIVNCDTGKKVYDFTNNLIRCKKDNIFEIVDKSTKTVISELYIRDDKVIYTTKNKNEEIHYSKYGYIYIEGNNKTQYYDFSTNKFTEKMPKNDNMLKSDEELLSDLTKTQCRDYVGLSKDNEVILDCEWNRITLSFLDENVNKYLKSKNKEYVLAQKEKTTYLIDINTKEKLVQFDNSSTYDIKNSRSLFVYNTNIDNGTYLIYSLTSNKQKSFDLDSSIIFYTNYFTIKEGNKLKYYNTDLEEFYSENI